MSGLQHKWVQLLLHDYFRSDIFAFTTTKCDPFQVRTGIQSHNAKLFRCRKPFCFGSSVFWLSGEGLNTKIHLSLQMYVGKKCVCTYGFHFVHQNPLFFSTRKRPWPCFTTLSSKITWRMSWSSMVWSCLLTGSSSRNKLLDQLTQPLWRYQWQHSVSLQ